MDVKTFDLRALVIKYDLEKVLLENYQKETIILNDAERKIINQYSDDGDDVLEYVRDLLIDNEQLAETKILLAITTNQIIQKYPLDTSLYQYIEELNDLLITSINNNTGNNKCLFLSESRILK